MKHSKEELLAKVEAHKEAKAKYDLKDLVKVLISKGVIEANDLKPHKEK